MGRMRSGILLTLFLAPMATAGDRLETPLVGGQMRFQGELIAETCSVEARDRHLIVKMGQVSSHRFQWVGDEADPVPFELHLQNCNTHVSRNVGVMFHGIADGKNPDMLSVGEGPGIATGIAVALFDAAGRFIPLNTPAEHWTPLQDGPVSLHFVAKYRATAQSVTGGLANAQAWFALTYQ
ncbi:fimbrial protein [Serratia fonticola]|jgi:fimbrial protein|uniref:Fimbrial protein n=1 Tax=Serratia fonticola TaxID=47917 RepID=A0A559T1V3_SERFO|nr:fimbrial protein [Serratia fonticola]TQI78920.1 fimbrial protein [Serratia fonticola]TQI99057.1 fimbrial protein [Serratia fonticola]TVZ68582.1 fimbrial protein [Serratia fonticola]